MISLFNIAIKTKSWHLNFVSLKINQIINFVSLKIIKILTEQKKNYWTKIIQLRVQATFYTALAPYRNHGIKNMTKGRGKFS